MVTQEFIKTKVAKNFTDAVDTVQSAANVMSYSFKNELNSVMNIEFPAGGGLVSGTYTSGVSDPAIYPLTGYVSGNVICFVVSYTNSGSVCAWAGQAIWNIQNSLWEIPTLWHLVEPTLPAEQWEDTYAGSDLFIQI